MAHTKAAIGGSHRAAIDKNESDQTVTVSFDNSTLTVAAPQGYLVQFLTGCNGPLGNPGRCSISAPLVATCASTNLATCVVAFTTVPTGQITYVPGWNLIAGVGVRVGGTDGSIYTFQAGDANYESLPPGAILELMKGYWVHFDQPTAETLPAVTGVAPVVQLPAGQWVMIGNPFDKGATVAGADVVYTYDLTSSQYQQASVIRAGQGAWAYSASGGTVTVDPVSP